ncbi:Uncharacterized protein family UPF0497, trans-membrane plant [Cynara cardunculus var. scolymus]|uniref:CASP-like protein n=1 Tax=Cynara cardunculus var. scolymus TaxID=59895 RepID=A0A118JYQ0_CYNCS|nr:Uncharacterized protein family UPF0497, trans-membrane plant [Cynara cardunculus var. scolymus]
MDFLKNHHRHHSSATSNRSISDTDSQIDDFHSPLRADSPLRSDDFPSSTSKAIVTYHPPVRSPLSDNQKPSHTINVAPLAKSSPAVTHNRSVREELVTGVTTKVGPGGVDDGIGGGDGASRRSRVPVTSISSRSRNEVTIERAALGFRVCEMILTLIAFSVMASDKTQGWSGDSFDRYKEYRYLVAVNAIAFAYAAFQAIALTFHLIYKRHIFSYSIRSHFDFTIDQATATRVDDWVSNWGKDEFTKMASASVVMSFFAFFGFAISSLVSGYTLLNQTHV